MFEFFLKNRRVKRCTRLFHADHQWRTASEKPDSSRVAEIMFRAERGEANAQFTLAVFYEQGRVIEQDRKKAADWYHKAALQGHLEAQFEYVVCLASGIGTAADEKEALAWARKYVAAQQNTKVRVCSLVPFVIVTRRAVAVLERCFSTLMMTLDFSAF